MWGRREAECDPLAGLGERVVRIAPTVLSNHGTVKAVAFREREKRPVWQVGYFIRGGDTDLSRKATIGILMYPLFCKRHVPNSIFPVFLFV